MRPLTLALPVLLGAATLEAQDSSAIARRVAQLRDGEVRMQYASRPGVCGDGRNVVAFGDAYFTETVQGFGRIERVRCVPGPVRVAITKRDGRIESVRTQVGGAWRVDAATDLGTVPARDAAAYFLALVPELERTGAASKGRLLLPAVLADSAAIAQPLLALARQEEHAIETRRQAVHFAGLTGDAAIVPAIVAIARTYGGDEGARGSSARGLGGAAVAALTFVPDDAGIPALMALLDEPSTGLRREVVFWLAQTDDARAHERVRRVAESSSEEMRVREHAIFSLAHGASTDDRTFAWLRALWSRAGDDRLKEKIAQGIAEDDRAESGRWLLDRVRDPRESLRVRKQTLFWAGQRRATSVRDLAAIAQEGDDPALREHAIFVLSQRDEDAATDALLAIARSDRDPRARKRALFWLGQRDDPRAARAIRDLITG